MSSLPHLKPVHGIRDPAKYANLVLVPTAAPKRGAERKAAAASEHSAEERLKRKVQRADDALQTVRRLQFA